MRKKKKDESKTPYLLIMVAFFGGITAMLFPRESLGFYANLILSMGVLNSALLYRILDVVKHD